MKYQKARRKIVNTQNRMPIRAANPGQLVSVLQLPAQPEPTLFQAMQKKKQKKYRQNPTSYTMI